MHRFAGPIRVIELLAMFDEMHPSINDASSKQKDKVPSFSLMSAHSPSSKHDRHLRLYSRSVQFRVPQVLNMCVSSLGL